MTVILDPSSLAGDCYSLCGGREGGERERGEGRGERERERERGEGERERGEGRGRGERERGEGEGRGRGRGERERGDGKGVIKDSHTCTTKHGEPTRTIMYVPQSVPTKLFTICSTPLLAIHNCICK